MRLLALALCLAAIGAGCAGPASPPTLETLQSRGLQELARSGPGPEIAPPPLLDPEHITPGDPPRAGAGLDVATDEIMAAVQQPPAPMPVAEADRRDALKRYASGRSRLRAGDAAGAAAELAEATSLDPEAGEVWLLRAEAELAARRRVEGLDSLQRAVELGAGSAVEREMLGRDAIDRRNFEEAARWLIDARRSQPQRIDEALALAIDVQLGIALEQIGYDAAARDLLGAILPALASTEPAGPFGPLIASALRQQRLYWTLLGDLCCRLGDYGDAVRAYERAAATAGPADPSLAEARCYAALRAGAPSYAAAIALQQAGESQRIDERAAGVMLYVAGASPAAADALRAALSGRQTEQTPADPSLSIVLARMTPSQATAILLEAHRAAPGDQRLIEALALSVADEPPQRAVEVAAGMIRAAPLRSAAITRAIVRSRPATAELIAVATASPDVAARMLGARALVLAGRPDDGLETLADVEDAGLAAGLELVRADVAADSGAWSRYERSIDILRADPVDRQALMEAFSAGQRFREAMDVAQALMAGASPSAAVTVQAAWLALGLGDVEQANQWLDAGVQRNPYNEQAHALRIRAASELPVAQTREKFSTALADLRSRLPGSATGRLLEARAMIAQGRSAEAQSILLDLAANPLRAAEALDMAQLLWSADAPSQSLLEPARLWLAQRASQHPQAPAYTRALGAVLLAQQNPGAAEAALREGVERFAWPGLQRDLEQLLRTTGKEAEANLLALRRLSTGPAGIDESLELADVRAQAGHFDSALASLARIPTAAQLTPEQTDLLVQVAQRAAAAAQASPTQDALAGAAALFDAAARPGLALPPGFHERRLALLVAWDESSPDQLARAVAQADGQVLDQDALLAARTGAELAERQRYRDCLRMFELLAAQPAGLSPTGFDVWLAVVEREGAADDGAALLAAAKRAGGVCALAERRGLDMTERRSEAECAAAIAGAVLGGLWDLQGRTDDAIEAFRLARTYLSDDPGTANDLGYTLLEARRDLAEAARLIELAYRAEPDNPNVLDSIGWLRYRQGLLDDEIGPDGRPLREGAVTLLERSAATPVGMSSATILDHLGDALWRAGRREAALTAWRSAMRVAENTPGGEGRRLRNKVRAAALGEAPDIAPVYDDWPDGASADPDS